MSSTIHCVSEDIRFDFIGSFFNFRMSFGLVFTWKIRKWQLNVIWKQPTSFMTRSSKLQLCFCSHLTIQWYRLKVLKPAPRRGKKRVWRYVQVCCYEIESKFSKKKSTGELKSMGRTTTRWNFSTSSRRVPRRSKEIHGAACLCE